MSEIYVCRCGEKKEPCVSCLRQTCNDLRSQLEEAREFKKFVARMIKLNLTHYMSDYEAIMEIDKQLKEQGDE